MNINQNDSCGLTHTQTYMSSFFSLLNKSANGNRMRLSLPNENDLSSIFSCFLEAIGWIGNRYERKSVCFESNKLRTFSETIFLTSTQLLQKGTREFQLQFHWNDNKEQRKKRNKSNEDNQRQSEEIRILCSESPNGYMQIRETTTDGFSRKNHLCLKTVSSLCQTSKFGNVRFFFYWEQFMHFALNCHQMLWNGRIYMELLSVFSFPKLK